MRHVPWSPAPDDDPERLIRGIYAMAAGEFAVSPEEDADFDAECDWAIDNLRRIERERVLGQVRHLVTSSGLYLSSGVVDDLLAGIERIEAAAQEDNR